MKKILAIIVIVIIGVLVWKAVYNPTNNPGSDTQNDTSVYIPSSQTTKVTDKLSEYKNDELGYSVKYPSTWEKIESAANVTFTIPTPSSDKEKNTVAKLETKIDVGSATCSFPPVTTVKERNTVKINDLSFNMMSMSNTVQGRNYFNRMYTLQKDSVCYFFTFSSITLSPTSKGYSGSEAQKIGSTNLKLVDNADSQFKDMIKTFNFVVGPAGQDETKVSPNKK